MSSMNCPHCGNAVQVPQGYMQWEGRCKCGRSVFDAVQDDDQEPEEVGDIYATGNGLSIVTPWGDWQLTDEQVLTFIRGLAHMLEFRLTQPSSEDDESTILSRGRELRRPAHLTSEIAAIGDTHC